VRRRTIATRRFVENPRFAVKHVLLSRCASGRASTGARAPRHRYPRGFSIPQPTSVWFLAHRNL